MFPTPGILRRREAWLAVASLSIMLDRSSRPRILAGLASIRRMPGFSTGDTTPQMMVLGLVIQRQDTVAGVARRLADQFASASFPRGSAHGNLPRLAAKGYVRLIEKGPPDEPTQDRYEATSEGIAFFRKWLRHTELPPVVRDALQCKLELLERADLAALIRLVRDEEKAYTAACDIARARVLREQRSKCAQSEAVDWRVRLRGIQNKDEVNLWGMMSKRLERLGDELEKLLGVISLGEAG
jgi:DNA-binding PadR family transcriptional regulator